MSVLAIHQRGYTNPQLLAKTDWLEQHLNDSNVRVVDARPPQQLRFSKSRSDIYSPVQAAVRWYGLQRVDPRPGRP